MAKLVLTQEPRTNDFGLGTLDANFTAIANFLNGGGSPAIDSTNFRVNTGISNFDKSSPYSYTSASVTIPSFTFAASETKTFVLWAHPHYVTGWNNGGTMQSDGSIDEENLMLGLPMQLTRIQAAYHGNTNLQTGDLIKLEIWGHRKGNTVVELLGTSTFKAAGTAAGTADGVMTSTNLSVTDCDYAYMLLTAVADATVATRTVNSTICTLWCKMPHVR
jgi:hypothetical protein